MGMVCSSEVRAAAAIAEDVGFDSLPCPPFSHLIRNWCPHHYCSYDSKAKILQKLTGLLLLLVIVCCSCTIKGSGEEESLIRLPTICDKCIV